MKRLSLFILVGILFNSCRTNDQVYIKSFDNKQAISIITKDTVRYVINGKHILVPDTNYISYKVPLRKFADEFGVCWDKDGYKWKMVNEGREIIDNKLDTGLYSMKIDLDVDESNIPTMINYMEYNCLRFTIEDNIGVKFGFLKPYHIVAENGKYVN